MIPQYEHTSLNHLKSFGPFSGWPWDPNLFASREECLEHKIKLFFISFGSAQNILGITHLS